jgi:hypothetical protein
MRTRWNGVFRGLTLLALLAVGLPSAFADGPPNPADPPEARIQPPGGLTSQARIQPPSGVTSQARIKPPSGDPTAAARITPPGGAPQNDARIGPPSGVTGEPGFFELVLDWLRSQARIVSPIG